MWLLRSFRTLSLCNNTTNFLETFHFLIRVSLFFMNRFRIWNDYSIFCCFTRRRLALFSLSICYFRWGYGSGYILSILCWYGKLSTLCTTLIFWHFVVFGLEVILLCFLKICYKIELSDILVIKIWPYMHNFALISFSLVYFQWALHILLQHNMFSKTSGCRSTIVRLAGNFKQWNWNSGF